MRRALLLGGLVFAMHAASASAVSVTVKCSQLQSELTAAVAGETITLDELCKSGFPYKLPAVPITLAGTPGAGFSGGSTVQLEGTKTSAVTIEGLAFENAKNTTTSNGGGLFIPAFSGPLEVVLERDSFIDDSVTGASVKAAADGGGAEINNTNATVRVSDSAFIGDSASSGAESSSDGGGLAIFAKTAVLTNDTFADDSAAPNGSGGGLTGSFSASGASLTNSHFTGNTATDGGGGAELSTNGPGGVGITLTGNTFSHNAVADPSGTSTSFVGYAGGGALVDAFGVEPTTIAQSGNVFDSNTVSFKAAPAMSNGGGEALINAVAESAGDQFTNNTLQSPDETENKTTKEHVFGWGAGLSVITCGDEIGAGTKAPSLTSSVADAVVAGNTLLSGPSASGAGVYVGILCPDTYSVLELFDSTVSGNAISGASGHVSGIDGGPHDVLDLTNTIVDGDSGGPELGGFAEPANVTAVTSDLCSGTAPFAGEGNICAAPALASAGTGDVHETAASPTRGRGDVFLIPAGIKTDAYGQPRPSYFLNVCHPDSVPLLDIGAAESGPEVFTPGDCAAGLEAPTVPVALVLSSVGESAKTWREGTALAQLSSAHGKRPPLGTTFTFTLSEAATVKLAFTTSARGRRVGKHCVAQTPKNRHKRSCTRTVSAGSLTVAAHAGVNKLRFDGVLAAHKRLPKGKTYTLTLTATGAGGSTAAKPLQFTIAR